MRWPADMIVCTAPALSMSSLLSIAVSGSSFSCSNTCAHQIHKMRALTAHQSPLLSCT